MKLSALLFFTLSVVFVSFDIFAGVGSPAHDPYGSQRWQDRKNFDRRIAIDDRKRKIDKKRKKIKRRVKNQRASETVSNEQRWEEDKEYSFKVMGYYALKSISQLKRVTTDDKKISFSAEFITPDNAVTMKGEYQLELYGAKGEEKVKNVIGSIMKSDNSKEYSYTKNYDLQPEIIAKTLEKLKMFNLLVSVLAIKEDKDKGKESKQFDTSKSMAEEFNTDFESLISNMEDCELFKLPCLSEGSKSNEDTVFMMKDLFRNHYSLDAIRSLFDE